VLWAARGPRRDARGGMGRSPAAASGAALRDVPLKSPVPAFLRGQLAGVVAAAAIAAVAVAGSTLLGAALFNMQHSPVSPVMLAVAGGVLFGQLPAVAARVQSGAIFASTTVLRLGIVLVGLKLSFANTLDIAGRALPIVAVCMLVAAAVALLLAYALGLRRELGILIAIGTSICGCTAVLASSPLLRARSEEVGYAISCVVLIGLTGMLVYPWLAHASFGSDPLAVGILLGTSIHDTSQVVGAALLYAQTFAAPQALAAATVAKLLRNLTLVLLLPGLALWGSRRSGAAGAPLDPASTSWSAQLGRVRAAVPGFVAVFLLLVVVRNAGDAAVSAAIMPGALWARVGEMAARISEYALTIGMAGVGLTLSIKDLPRLGMRPFAVAIGAAIAVAGTSWLLTGLWHS